MSTRRSVPVGVQFITGVGGFAAGLVSLSSLLLLGLSIREGEFGLAVQVLPMLVLGLGHIVSLYGLVTLRQWGYKWTRRLFALTLLVHLPAVQTGNPIQVGTLAFSGVVLGYLWLLRDASVFTSAPAADDSTPETPGDGPVEVDTLDDDDGATTIDVDPLDGAGDRERDRDRERGRDHDETTTDDEDADDPAPDADAGDDTDGDDGADEGSG